MTATADVLRWYRRGANIQVHTVSIAAIFVALMLFFGLFSEHFFTTANLANAARDTSPVIIVSVAMTYVITCGSIDLSVGSLLAVCSACLGLLSRDGSAPVVLVEVLLIGVVSGAVSGYISAYHRIQAFIVTLAGLTALRGVAVLITQGYSVPIDSALLLYLGQAKVLGIYVQTWIALVVAVVGWYGFSHTRYGRYVTAVGSNDESTRRAGVNVRRIRFLTLVGTGAAAAVAGILTASQLGTGTSNVGVAFELQAITAVVLGGTSLTGGRGSIIGTVLGALTLGVLSNGLVLIGLNVYWVPVLQGLILLAAIFANSKVFARFRSAGKS